MAEDLGKGLSRILLKGGGIADKKAKKGFVSIRVRELATEGSRLLCVSLPPSVQSKVYTMA